MMNEQPNKAKTVFGLLLIGVLGFGLLIGFSGCSDDDDDETVIEVCNGDDEEYLVKLHRHSDDVVISEVYINEVYDVDRCDKFEDLSEGRYYLTIYKDGGSVETDRTNDFYLDNDEHHTFRIDSTGTIDD